jgi:hypothetical protein
MTFNKDKTFTKEEFSRICKYVREKSPSLDRDTLLMMLFLQLQRELGEQHPGAELTDVWETKAQGYKYQVNVLLRGRMNPPFDYEEAIFKDLLHEEFP